MFTYLLTYLHAYYIEKCKNASNIYLLTELQSVRKKFLIIIYALSIKLIKAWEPLERA